MKKLLLVLAIVVAYGVSTSTASAKVVDLEKASVTVVADNSDMDTTTPDGEVAKKTEKKAKAKTVKAEDCAGAKAGGCDKEAKKACCGGEKAAKSCDGKKK